MDGVLVGAGSLWPQPWEPNSQNSHVQSFIQCKELSKFCLL
jgi:hypothetical protein